VKLLWALALLGASFVWSLHAFGPLVKLWHLDDLEQPGQLSVFNRVTEGGFFGLPVELGDYDGDGKPDLVIAPMASPGDGGERSLSGQVYIYKGTGRIEGAVDRGEMTAPFEGVTISGARPGDMAGTEIFTADVNGDGIHDLLVSSQNYDGPAGDRMASGGAFIILGRSDLLAGSLSIDLASPPSGVVTIAGAAAGDRLGIWVEAGDIDGDGFQDVLLGADQSPTDTSSARHHAGKVFVIYGRAVFPTVIDLAAGAGGLEGVATILGKAREDHFGSTLHARDLDLDGRDEIIASAALSRLSASESGGDSFPVHSSEGADGAGRADSGEVVILFSLPEGQRLPRTVDLAALPPALEGKVTTIIGRAANDLLGEEITTGDFDGDGRPDLALGGLTASSPIPPFPRAAGIAHVLYWKDGLEGVTIDLGPDVPGGIPDGLIVSTIHGVSQLEILGDTLSAGDFDHDGFDDLAIGIPHADVDVEPMAGIVAVAFGRPEPWPPLWAPRSDTLPPGLQLAVLLGREALDLTSYSMEARDFDGDGYADLFPNAMRGDGSFNRFRDAGEAYLVSGFRLASPSQTPAIDRVEPREGPVSATTPVVITGAGFTTRADTRLFAGTREVADFTVVNGRRIEAVLPAADAPGPVAVTVTNRYGTVSADDAFTYVRAFIRGDTNLDGAVNISDPVATLNGLFLGDVIACHDAADANDDGRLNITDPIATLNHLFLGSGDLPAPFPEPGSDPTPDDLPCA
jgi:hypothetical protein